MKLDEHSSIGCDLGGTAIKFVHLGRGKVVARHQLPTPDNVTGESLVEAVARGVLEIDAPRSDTAGCSVGMAVPGFLDEQRRNVDHVSNLEGLDGFALASRLEERLDAAVLLETDSNCGALAEGLLGAGRTSSRLLYVTIGTGLGAALLADGKLLRVSHHTVGHVAHIPLGIDGPGCRCGQTDCAESLLGADGIVARAAGVVAHASPLSLFHAARNGERRAQACWAETGQLLGQLLRILVPFLEPARVVIGGGIAGAAEFFLPACRETLARSLPEPMAGKITVVPAEIGTHAGATGAALLSLFDDRDSRPISRPGWSPPG